MIKKGFYFALIFCNLFCVFEFTSKNANAKLQSEYVFKQISFEQGLPGYDVKDQIQDQNGIMWFCINSIGLCRYDGHKYTLFKNNPLNPNSLSNDFINKIIEDSFGNLWIATDYGLNKFSKEEQLFTVFYCNENDSTSISNNICNTVYHDSKGNIWVGTQNGLSVKEKLATNFKRFFFNGDLNKNSKRISVLSIKEQSNGIFWIGTNQGLIKFDPTTGQYKKWENQKSNSSGPIHNKIADILQHNNYLWLATYDGIDRFNLKTEQFDHWKYTLQDEEELTKEGICSLISDKSGNIWAGTFTKGILVINPQTNEYKRIQHQHPNEISLKCDHIQYLFEDNMGLLWVGTKFEGVFKFNENAYIFNQIPDRFTGLSPLSNLYLLSFAEDNDSYWVGTKQNGLFKVNKHNQEIVNYKKQKNKPNYLTSNRIQFLLNDSENKLWVGADNGLFQLDKTKGLFVPYSSIPVTWVNEDRNGNIWVGTISGVFIVDITNEKLQRFSSPGNYNFFNSNDFGINQIYTDKAGTIWFTTVYNGLHSYQPATDSYLSYPLLEKNDLKGIYILKVLEDKKGNFWLGTKSGGLIKYTISTNKTEKFTTENGLTNNVIQNIQEDKYGNIWLGTHNGISKYNPETNHFINYNSDYGLRSINCESAASYAFSSGELLFGGNNGFNIFDPENIQPNDFVAPIIITSIKANDEEIAKNIDSDQQILLNYSQNVVSFEFVLIDYNNPNRHQYSVFLKGIDKDWKLIGNQNTISYTNLKPGKYTFQARGANEFGNWSGTPYELAILISGPIYKRLWFKILVFLFLILAIIIVIILIRKRETSLEKLIDERTKKLKTAYKELLLKNTKIREQNRQIERHQIELEQKVTERTHDLEIAKRKAEESDRLKSSFLANMSHEIRTPLNAITGFSTLVSNENYSTERKQKYVNIIKTNAASLLKLVEDILDVSRIEAGQLTIKKQFFDVSLMLSEINDIFQEELKNKHENNVELIVHQSNPFVKTLKFYSDEIRIRQILVNLLSNAIKFTTVGKVEVGCEIKETSILFWVKDSGIGIKEKDIHTIFNHFTKIEEENAIYRGTGLGLSISQSLANMLNGKIWVESQVNVGSSFYVELPGELKITRKNETLPIEQNIVKPLNIENKFLLVVEEDRMNFILLQTYLAGTNAHIIWAKNGENALTRLNDEKFDLILLDIRSTGIDAYETLTKIKKIYPNIPVIAQTAYANIDEKLKMLALGFNDYIIKPFTKEELLKKLAQQL